MVELVKDRWKCNDGNWSLTLGKGLVKANINYRMTNPSGWDVWINGDRIKEAVPELETAMDIAIKDIEHRARMLSVQLNL